MKRYALQITDVQYKKLVTKSKNETLRRGDYVSIAEIIRVLIDKYIDKIEFRKRKSREK